MATLPFSDDTKRVIAESRLLALDLGYDYIAAIHFFLADCQLFPLSSCKSLLFQNERDFQAFRTTMRVGHANPAVGSVPLLRETERALKAAKKVAAAHGDTALHPCHLLLGASQLPGSFTSLLAAAGLTAQDVQAYYVRTGQLRPLAGQAFTEQGVFRKSWQSVRERVSRLSW